MISHLFEIPPHQMGERRGKIAQRRQGNVESGAVYPSLSTGSLIGNRDESSIVK